MKHTIVCFLALVGIVLSCISCAIVAPVPDEAISGKILQPGVSSFDVESVIVFQAELNVPSGIEAATAKVQWVSSLDGMLGEGVWLSRKLMAGEHVISLLCQEHELARKTVTIQSTGFSPGQTRQLALGAATNTIVLPAGKYSPLLYSLDGKIPAVHMHEALASQARGQISGAGKIGIPEAGILAQKSFSLMSGALPPSGTIRDTVIPGSRDLSGKSGIALRYMVGQSRSFLVADTSGIQSDGISVAATLVHSSSRLNIWIDNNAQVSGPVLASFLSGLTSRAWPRVKGIWGDDWVDLDGDDSLAVLITPLINQQQMAIGFFNPADLYPRSVDQSSPEYNPVSNEMDIVYLAAPVGGPLEFSYSVNSILATFCHETMHLIGFSRSYYLPTACGQTVAREESFLDEGLAHLTESLCGYGESGGNLAFLGRYLEDPGLYSLCGSDFGGANDSIGKRGMAAAFLSWLFWQKGGATWDAQDAGKITDRGGLSFLRYLLATSNRGMDNISAAFGRDAKALLVRWFTEVDLQDTNVVSRPVIVRDPIGGESLLMAPFFGDLIIGPYFYIVNGPIRKDLGQTYSIPAFSARWGLVLDIAQKSDISIETSIPDMASFAVFDMIE